MSGSAKLPSPRRDTLARALPQARRALLRSQPLPLKGRLTRAVGTVLRARVPEVRIGELCRLESLFVAGDGALAEVIGFDGDEALLTPLGDTAGLSSRTEVVPTGTLQTVPVGRGLIGRVVDAFLTPIDGASTPATEKHVRLEGRPPPPLARRSIDTPLATGVRVIDGLLTLGSGQRIAVFGSPGSGKSSLLASIVRHAAVDVCVVALVGERGREVRDFLERDLGDGLRRAVVVVATSDRPAIERLKAAQAATAVAEFFRDGGRSVLLLMDSVTRLARALREVGLAAGEPPTRRGFPPSVFAALPRLLERPGRLERGVVTAVYTVLTEGEEEVDPIAEEVRGIVDGHVVLSRDLAAGGHFPAIDVLRSASRLMPRLTAPRHLEAAVAVRRLLSRYEEVKLLIQVGEYAAGSDPLADRAIAQRESIEAFLRQGVEEASAFAETVTGLEALP